LRHCQDLLESIVDEQGAPASLRQRVAQRIAEIYSFGAEYQAEAVLLDVWIPNVLETIRDEFQHRRIVLELALDVGPAVCLPEPLLFKSFRGLLRNAIEATPDGRSICVGLHGTNGNLRLEIRDTGVGIDTELQEQLFHGFVHAGPTESYSSGRPYDFGAGGMGLDLQRIKLFSERYGFQLQFTSEVGVGSVFALDFPPGLLRPRGR
jgi:signal transduction histidine kinase